MSIRHCVAVDLGASSGRVMLASYQPGPRALTLREIHRFTNSLQKVDGFDCWDVDSLEGEIRRGLEKVCEQGILIDSIGIDTWGVDYGLLDKNGRPLFRSDMQGATNYALDGAPLYFPENGSFDATKALMIAGNFKKIVYSIRQDVTVKILDQGVIQDPTTKEIVYNLAQQDMIALRVVMRMGWALPNPSTRLNTDGSKVPFSYIVAGE